MNILGCIMFYRNREHFIYFTGIGCSILILALFYPKALIPVKKILDLIIFTFSRIVNVVTLLFAFYLIFTPIAILLKLFSRDLLAQKIDKNTDSYWIKREKGLSRKSYEHMG